MRQTKELFLNVLKAMSDHGALNQVILIGSWSQLFYQHYFKEDVRIPAVRTLDLDFLIPNPPKIKTEVNVSNLLKDLGFKQDIHSLSGIIKYNHPDLLVEFLIPELGRGKSTAYEIPMLHINAVGLRYLNFLQSHTMNVEYEGFTVKVPEPTAFVLHKHIISERRLNILKREKDKQSAIELGRYLLTIPEQKIKFKEIFVGMPKKWKKDLLEIVAKDHESLYEYLKSSQ